jgi:hypothetical protein
MKEKAYNNGFVGREGSDKMNEWERRKSGGIV